MLEARFLELIRRQYFKLVVVLLGALVAQELVTEPKIRAINVMMRKLSAEKGRLAAQEDEESVSSIDSDETDDPHKAPPLPPTDRARSRGSSSITSADDLSSLKRLLGLDN